jgi:tungstate transport system substrate-binding protein
MALWQKAGIKPSGPWYNIFEKGSTGNVPTLQYTDQTEAYTVIDRATFLSIKDKIKLIILVEKDEALLNFMSLIPVNPNKFSKANYLDSMLFVKWLTAPEKGRRSSCLEGDKCRAPLFPQLKVGRQARRQG